MQYHELLHVLAQTLDKSGYSPEKGWFGKVSGHSINGVHLDCVGMKLIPACSERIRDEINAELKFRGVNIWTQEWHALPVPRRVWTFADPDEVDRMLRYPEKASS